uniref:Uncharacterized protein n=1 Tax=Oryza sativa subsp. japonica TaxID=39947 RepID=Q69KU6_ORYSJ|nr:hypothetical protein [Oryza sativa Japonica Group]BAD34160.1 hypothetical protein [Oryza sativa Japonica Group]
MLEESLLVINIWYPGSEDGCIDAGDAKLDARSNILASQDLMMDVSDVDTATVESKAADATTMSPTTSTSSDASRNQDQSESQFVFQEQAPATSDSTPPSLQQTSTAKSPPIPEATSATYSGYGLQGQFLQGCSTVDDTEVRSEEGQSCQQLELMGKSVKSQYAHELSESRLYVEFPILS